MMNVCVCVRERDRLIDRERERGREREREGERERKRKRERERARRQRSLEVGWAVAAGAMEGGLRRVNGLEVEDRDGGNLRETVARRGKDGELERVVVKGFELSDWCYVAGRAEGYKWRELDVR